MKRLGKEWRNVSVSTGTHITDDVFEAVRHLLPEDLADDFLSASPEEAYEILWGDIFDYLNSIAPEGCYFGAHPGDGSDFGFWEWDESDFDDSFPEEVPPDFEPEL